VTRIAEDSGKVSVCSPEEVAQLHDIAQTLNEDLNAQFVYKP
jgi:hypothetical protein